MALKPGDSFPDVTLATMTSDGIKQVSTGELFRDKRTVLFSVPGAFTPTCNDTHLPGFLIRQEELKAKGVDLIACVSVNDPFVMNAWGKASQVGDAILMLADGNGSLAKAMGLELDASRFGMGTRSRRYAAIVDHGKLELLNVEPAGEVGVSSAETVLSAL